MIASQPSQDAGRWINWRGSILRANQQQAGISSEQTGRTLGLAAFIGACFSILAGPLADIFGATTLIRYAIIASLASAIALTKLFGLSFFIISIVCLIAFKSSLDTLIKTHMAQEIHDTSSYESAMKSRYFLTNLAALLGPLFYFMTKGSLVSLAAIIFLTYALFLVLLRSGEVRHSKSSNTINWKSLVKAGQDRGLLLCVLHGGSLFYVVSQMTLVLPQYFVSSKHQHVELLISFLVSWNALLVVILHPFYQRYSRSISRRGQLVGGGILVILSQVFLCLIGGNYDVGVVAISSTIFTIGELFLFPLYSLLLSRLTTKTMQGTYSGLGSLYLIGAVLGPIIGTWLLGFAGVFYVFVISTIISTASLIFSLLVNHSGENRLVFNGANS